MLKQIVENTSPQTEADTVATEMNTKVTYENDAARKQKAATMAREAEMSRLNTQSTIQLTQAQKEEAAASVAAKAANEVQTNSEAEQLMVKAGLLTSEQLETKATIQASLADIQLAINSGKVTLAEGQQIATTLGLDAAQLKAAKSAGLLSKIWGSMKAHPVLWAVGAITAAIGITITALDKAKQKYLDTQQDIIDKADEIISKNEEEIKSLEELQTALKEAGTDKQKLAQISGDLNKAIGDTAGLLKGESEALDIANQKLQDRINLLEKEKQLELDKKIQAQENIYKNNVINNTAGFDVSIDKVRSRKIVDMKSIKNNPHNLDDSFTELFENAELSDEVIDEIIQWFIDNDTFTVGKAFDFIKSIAPEIDSSTLYETLSKNANMGYKIDADEFQEYFDEQADKAKEVLSEFINDSTDIFDASSLNNMIVTWAEQGLSLEEIQANLDHIANNEQLKSAIDTFYESLYDPEADSEAAANRIQEILWFYKAFYPELTGFFDNFYNNLFKHIEEKSNGAFVINSKSFDKVFNADDFKEQKEELLEFAKAGELTPETLKSVEGYNKLLDDTELSAREACKMINNLVTATERLNGTSDAFSPLETAYKEFKEQGYTTVGSIESLRENFGELKDIEGNNIFENFANIVGSKSTTIDEKQNAFNDLATLYINSKDVLDKLTESNKEYYITQLEDIGITNARSIVTEKLLDKQQAEQLQTEALGYSKADLADAEKDLISLTSIFTKATKEKITKLLNQSDATLGCRVQLFKLAVEEQLFSSKELDPSGKIKGLVDLAEAYGVTSAYIEQQRKAIEADELSGGHTGLNYTNADVKHAVKELYDAIYTEYDKYSVDGDAIVEFGDGKNATNSSETFDWIETKISRLQRVISNFGKTVSATWKSWEDRNDAILKQLPKLEEELSVQKQARQYYLNEANKVGLTEKNDDGISYAELVREGAIDIDKVTGDELKEKISTYQDLYEKALAAEDRIIEIEGDIVDKYNEQMDLTESKFNAKINLIEGRIGVIDSLIAQEEAQGHLVSKGYYEAMLAEQTANRDALIEKKKQLEADFAYAMANSGVKEGTEQWYEWKARIIEVESAINGLNTELIETGNLIREVDWEVFDFKQERISKLTEEADYLIGLMSNEKLYDDDTGELTNYGDATAGLHATNYNVYKLQAQEYADEIAEIDKQLEKDPYDLNLLKRRDEFLESHRDMVNAAEDEEMAIRDMVEEGYNILIDSIQEIIDKNMEAKNSIKDLYDYEKSISEKTKNISSLKKKIDSTEGDDSEEAQAQIQKWKVELEEAEQDLYETEWERQLSDEQKMLDGLVEDAQDWIDKRLEKVDELLSDIVANTNAESGAIATTLQGVAEKFNTPISSEIEKFFDTDNESAVSDFLNNFTDEETGVFKAVNGIKDGVDDMVDYLKDQADENIDGDGTPDGNSGNTSGDSGSNSGNNSNNTSSDTNKSPSNDKNTTKGDGEPKVGDRVIFDNGMYYSTEYGTGKTGNQMLGKEVFITKIASSGSKRYHIGRTSKHGERNLGWVDLKQLKGYYTGSKHIDEDQWAWTQEKGREAVIRNDGAVLMPLGRGDMVLNNAATETFYKLMNNPKIMEMLDSMIMPQISAGTSLPNLVNKGVNNTQSVEINLGGIQMYGVNDPEKFAVQLQHALKTDRMSEKIVQSIAWDKAMGRNSLSKHRY